MLMLAALHDLLGMKFEHDKRFIVCNDKRLVRLPYGWRVGGVRLIVSCGSGISRTGHWQANRALSRETR